MSRTSLLAPLFTALLLAACGSSVTTVSGDGTDGGTSETSTVTREQACTDISKALCDQYEKCLPLLITIGYGDAAKCPGRVEPNCPSYFDAPKTSSRPEKVDACAAAIAGLSCDKLSQMPPSACVPDPGGLDDDASCIDDAQCKSTWCAKADNQICGKCAKLSTAGSACVSTGTKDDGSADVKCSRGFTCGSAGCAKPGLLGDTCNDSAPCSLGLACFMGKCAQAGKPGSKCDPMGTTQPACDILQGAYCNPATSVCAAFGVAKPGESCGLVGSEYKICAAGGKCSASGLAMGTCIAPAADGATCDSKAGPGCAAPALCVAGKCTLPDPNACK